MDSLKVGKYIDSPIGRFYALMENCRIVRLDMGEAREGDYVIGVSRKEPEWDSDLKKCYISWLENVEVQLGEYFRGERKKMELPPYRKTLGTDFQEAVWEEMRRIPYGETRTYGEIAAAVGRPKAARAVGGACNRNPIMILNPCHRVVGKNGALVGFAGGLAAKEWLLQMEKRTVEREAAAESEPVERTAEA